MAFSNPMELGLALALTAKLTVAMLDSGRKIMRLWLSAGNEGLATDCPQPTGLQSSSFGLLPLPRDSVALSFLPCAGLSLDSLEQASNRKC